eukprot:g677.t1
MKAPLLSQPSFTFDFTLYDQVLFDEARKLLVLIRNNVYFTLSLGRAVPSLSSAINFISEGPVLSVHFSSNKRFIAIQRSSTTVEIVDIFHRTELELSCRHKESNLLLRNGVAWCKYADNTEALFLVTQLGIEVYRLTSSTKGTTCKYVRSVKHSMIHYFWFCPLESGKGRCEGVLLLSTGRNGRTLRPYLLNSYAPLKLPKFEVDAPIDVNSIRVASMYGRLCCIHLHHDAETEGRASRCSVFALSRSDVTLTRQFPLYATGPVTLHMLDNLLVIHQPSTQCSMIFDAKTRSNEPVTNPLPLALDSTEPCEAVCSWTEQTKQKISTFDVVFSGEMQSLGLELLRPSPTNDEENENNDNMPSKTKMSHNFLTIVNGFHREKPNLIGPAEKCGKIKIGDYLAAVNGQNTSTKPFETVLAMIRNASRPITLRFERLEEDKSQKNEEKENHENSSANKEKQRKNLENAGKELYASHWQYLWPHWLLDMKNGVVWCLEVSLEQVVRTSADPVLLVPFLQRRTVRDLISHVPKDVLIRYIKTLIEERTSLPTLCRIFSLMNFAFQDWIRTVLDYPGKLARSGGVGTQTSKAAARRSASYLNYLKSTAEAGTHRALTDQSKNKSKRKSIFDVNDNDNDSGNGKDNIILEQEQEKNNKAFGHDLRTSTGLLVVTMDEMYDHIFFPMACAKKVSSDYLCSVFLEYLRNLLYHNIAPLTALFELVAEMLVLSKKYNELYQLMQYHIPQDTRRLAMILLNASVEYPPLVQPASDILLRLGERQLLVQKLLDSGEILSAVKIVLDRRRGAQNRSQRTGISVGKQGIDVNDDGEYNSNNDRLRIFFEAVVRTATEKAESIASIAEAEEAAYDLFRLIYLFFQSWAHMPPSVMGKRGVLRLPEKGSPFSLCKIGSLRERVENLFGFERDDEKRKEVEKSEAVV